MRIPIHEVHPNPDQPRKKFDRAALEELSQSIREMGLLQPILVRPSDFGYEIIAGERRWRASKLAELSEIEAVVLESTDDEMLIRAIAENVNRRDMTPLEEARAFQRVVDSGRSPEEVARIFGKTLTYVSLRLSYLNLIPELQLMLDAGGLTKGLATCLADLSPASQQSVMVRHNRGEFRDELEAIRFGRALAMHEAQTGLFEIEDEATVEARRERRTRLDRTLGKVREMANVLHELEEHDDVELARILEDRAPLVSQEIRLLSQQVARLAVKVERSASLIKASER